jgi:O-methyltransferase
MIRGIFDVLTKPEVRPEWRWRTLSKLGKWLMPNYRLPWPQTSWWNNQEFNDFLKRFHEYGGYNSDRRWTVHQLTKLAASVPGDTAECGVLEGSSSYLIARAFSDRTHYMFDSFEGCSEPTSEDNTYFFKGTLACSMEEVRENLKDCPNLSYHKGWIPERFADVESRRFAFVHIDVQLYKPTYDSLAFFYPRMNKGGIMIFDDYGFTTCPGATRAIEQFLTDKKEPIIELSCGSAFILKA